MADLIQLTKNMVDAQDALNSNFNTLKNMITGDTESATKQEFEEFKNQVSEDIKKVSKPSTLVIGTKTSNHTNCDLLCDGTNDEIEINQAIQKISIGGKITILEGTYNISEEIVIDKPNITIEGMGNASTQLKRMFNTTGGTSSASTYTGIVKLMADNITLNNIYFDGNKDNYNGGLNNYNCNIYDSSGHNYITINNCFINNSYYGIRISGVSTSTSNYIIQDNVLDNNGTGIYSFSLNNSNIRGNKIINISNNAIISYSSNNLIFTDNIIKNCSGNSIYFYQLSNSIIDGNIVDKTTKDNGASIFLSYCEDSTISNNNILNAINGDGLYGVNCSNNVIEGNRVTECKSFGIRILTNSLSNTINSNNLYNTRGLGLGNGATGNVVSSNIIKRGNGTSSDYTVDGSTQYSVYVMSGATKNLIIGNVSLGKNYTNSAGSSAGNTFANNKY